MAAVAFAKLLGDNNFVHYVTKETLTLGRTAAQSDVVLGDNKNISRCHARIAWNPDTSSFELTCLSKNGVFVDGQLSGPSNPPVPLHSRTLIQIGPRLIYFLLPKSTSTTVAVDGEGDVSQNPPRGLQVNTDQATTGKKWNRTKRERIRMALMRYGFGRWDALAGILDDRDYSLVNVQVYCCQLVQQLIASCDDAALAAGLRELLSTAPVAMPDEDNPDSSLVDWSSLQKNAKKWATRLILLHELKTAIDMFGEKELLSDIGTIKGRPLGGHWGRQEDLDLCRGIYRHGFGEFNAILNDEALCFKGRWANRQEGSKAEAEEEKEDDDVSQTGVTALDSEAGPPAAPAGTAAAQPVSEGQGLPEWPQHLALIGRLKRILDLLRVKISKNYNGSVFKNGGGINKRKIDQLGSGADMSTPKKTKLTASRKKSSTKKRVDSSWTIKDQAAFQRGIVAQGHPPSWNVFRNANPSLADKLDAEMDDYYDKFIEAVDRTVIDSTVEEQSEQAPDGDGDESMTFTVGVAVKIKERIDLFDRMRDILAVGDLRLLHVPPDPALSGFYQSWAGEHDLQFLKGVVEHGIGNWAAIFKDPNLPLLSSLHGLPADTKVLSRRLQQILSAVGLDLDVPPLKSKYQPRHPGAKPSDSAEGPGAKQSGAIPSPVVYDADGRVVLPIQVTSSLRLLSLGTVVNGRGFRDGKHVFPIGFKSERDYPSLVDPARRCKYVCEVIEGRDARNEPCAQFRVICADLPDEPIVADRPTPVWKQIETRLDSKRNTSRKRSTINGMEKFGLNNPLVISLLSESAGADGGSAGNQQARPMEPTVSHQSTEPAPQNGHASDSSPPESVYDDSYREDQDVVMHDRLPFGGPRVAGKEAVRSLPATMPMPMAVDSDDDIDDDDDESQFDDDPGEDADADDVGDDDQEDDSSAADESSGLESDHGRISEL
ncbi:unnamed protein product (mitochondrion) [Plasmodiophora brassicae]|uniref:FHA domain-containing protein n=1 Tax=Plasmodiophora brassicae TaxID=37360 RepID=A0A0G4IN48_PLABS|nr:hypothetical protein PBRA_005337 [Plasmodiophora brassicae]SPQ95393.1 unnamed protein product [Plasmodiophora brassicae]